MSITDFLRLARTLPAYTDHHREVDGSDQRTEKTKAADNLVAIRILKRLVTEQREPTSEEQRQIGLFYGFGGLPNMFRQPDGTVHRDWRKEALELEALTTPEEYASLKARTVDAQYTSDEVVQAIWGAVSHMMPKEIAYYGGRYSDRQPLEVLEPSVGSGVFLDLAPENLPIHFTGIEMDSITAAVTKALHPNQRIINSPFQKANLHNTFDLVVGNPPFGKTKLLDRDRPDLTQAAPNTHGYFFVKSIDRLRPNGYAIMVTSRYLLDADRQAHRDLRLWLHKHAELVTAVRLPNTAFSKTAFTEVVTDVVVFRKRETPLEIEYEAPTRRMVEEWVKERKKFIKDTENRAAQPHELVYPLPDHFPNWILGSAVIAMGKDEKGHEGVIPVLGSGWYRDHPDHILGKAEIGWGLGLYRGGAPIVLPDTERFPNLGQAIQQVFLQDLPTESLLQVPVTQDRKALEYPQLSAKEMNTSPFGYFVVPDSLRAEALKTWVYREEEKQENTLAEAFIRVPVANPKETLSEISSGGGEIPLLIGMRVPDVTDIDSYEKKSDWTLVTFSANLAVSSARRLAAMIDLRDTLSALVDLQKVEEKETTQDMNTLRKELRQKYRKFVREFGYLHDTMNQRLMRNDPSWAMLSGLEVDYEPQITKSMAKRTGEQPRKAQALLSDIFERRTQFPRQVTRKVDNAIDALTLCLTEKGGVDPAFLLEVSDLSLEEIKSQLRVGANDALVFINPNGQWVEREDWLSGDIPGKMRWLERVKEQSGDPVSWEKEIAVLAKHLPERISILERTVNFGAFWLPEKVVADFLEHLGATQVFVSKNDYTQAWTVVCGDGTATLRTDNYRLSELSSDILNRKPITVTYKDDFGNLVVDEEKTALANEKATQLVDEWKSWLFQDLDRVQRLEDQYNKLMNTYRPRSYNGSHLQFPGSNPQISLRPHQKNAVWRTMQSKSVLFDHVVGAGKTFAAIASVMKKKEAEQVRKPLVVVPNHLVAQWAADWMLLYPDAKILVPEEQDMKKGHRQHFLAKAAYNDVDAVIMSHSSFDLLPIDPEYYEMYVGKEKEKVRLTVEANPSDTDTVKKMQKRIQSIESRVERMHENAAGARDEGLLNFTEVGFDLLVIDESHNYKNVPYITTLQGVRGLGNPAGSIKAENAMIKVTQCREGDGGVIFLTGTPLSNTVAELYLLQLYLDPDALTSKGIHSFDAWVSAFASIETENAFTMTGTFKQQRTLASFSNLPELVGLYRKYADVIAHKDIDQLLRAEGKKALPIPKVNGGKAQIVVCPMTPMQRKLIGEEVGFDEITGEPQYEKGSILWRVDNLPKRPGPGEDNILVVINDLRKAGLDARAFDPSYTPQDGEETGKLNVVAENIHNIYHKWDEDKGTQLVYLDFCTPKKYSQKEKNALDSEIDKILAGEAEDATDLQKQQRESALERLLAKYTPDEIKSAIEERKNPEARPFDAYNELRNILAAKGIPPEEVAFIHDADSDEKKSELFAQVRSGKVRVLVGSTPKMGPGMNVQDRLVAVHHIDAPYRPTDVEQRNGRILRQGNLLLKKYGKKFAVDILYYVTENSSDAGLWQILETKKKFIDTVRYFDNKTFTVADPDSQAMDPAAVKAMASGHELLMIEVPLRNKVKRLNSLERGYRQEKKTRERRIESLRESIVSLSRNIDEAKEYTKSLQELAEALKYKPEDQDEPFIPWGNNNQFRISIRQFNQHCVDTLRDMQIGGMSTAGRVGLSGKVIVNLRGSLWHSDVVIEMGFADAKAQLGVSWDAFESTAFDDKSSTNFYQRFKNCLEANWNQSAVLQSRIEKHQNELASMSTKTTDFEKQEELNAAKKQHAIARRLMQMRFRKLDNLEDRLSGYYLGKMPKETPATDETGVAIKINSPEQERESRAMAKELVAEFIEAFSMPPVTKANLEVLEKIGGVPESTLRKLRDALVETDDVQEQETAQQQAEEVEEIEDVAEERQIDKEQVVSAANKNVGLQSEQVLGSWLEDETQPFFVPEKSFSQPAMAGAGAQVDLFADIFGEAAPTTPPEPRKPTAPRQSPAPQKPLDLGDAPLFAAAGIEAESMKPAETESIQTSPVPAFPVADPAAEPVAENKEKNLETSLEVLRGFLSASQWSATQAGLRSEDKGAFAEIAHRLAEILNTMPRTYETDGQGSAAIGYLHYFKGAANWYITELDKDPDGAGQIQAFGLADLGMGMAELGYINIQELIQNNVDLDYHFQPTSLRELRAELAAQDEPTPAPIPVSAPGNWQSVEYMVDPETYNLVVDATAAPFHGEPVLLTTMGVVMEAVWLPQEGHGEDAEGFCWLTGNGDKIELEEARFWSSLPDNIHPVSDLPGFAPYRNEESLLIRIQGEGNPYWAEAWYDKELNVWQVNDARYEVTPDAVVGFAPLPEPPSTDPEPVLTIPTALQKMALPEQIEAWEQSDNPELMQMQLARMDGEFSRLPSVSQARQQALDGRAGLVLRSMDGGATRWLITGLNADGRSAFGLQIANEEARLGEVDLRIALQDAPLLEIGHEPGPLYADLRDAGMLLEQVQYRNDPRMLLWRGGPDSSLPRVERIEDILDYERNEMDNADVQFAQEGLEYLKLPPVRSLQWLTLTEEAAQEYGKPHPVILVDPVFLARDAHDGVLVAERAGLEQMAQARRLEQSPIDADESATAEYPEIPVSVARFMGDAQKTLLTTMFNSTDQNPKSMLSPHKIREQLDRLDRWLRAGSATTMQEAQAKGLNAVGQMALPMRNGDLVFMSAISEDGTSGYGMTLQTMTHRATLGTLDLSIFDRDNWTVDLTHQPQSLLVTLIDHGYSREAVTIEPVTQEPVTTLDDLLTAAKTAYRESSVQLQQAIETLDAERLGTALKDAKFRVDLALDNITHQGIPAHDPIRRELSASAEALAYRTATDTAVDALIQAGKAALNAAPQKTGIAELASKGESYQRAVTAIEQAGGWDAVADSPALQKSLTDQLDHLIQLRAGMVAQILGNDGWEWSGAAFSKDGEAFKIFPNGRSANGNMVHWGYRLTSRAGDQPVAIDIDDNMTTSAADLVQSMLRQIAPEVAPISTPETQKHLESLRPFVTEKQFSAIRAVLAGETGWEASQTEAAHLARLAQWIDQQGMTYPGGRYANGGHPLPDDAAVQGTAATCVLAYTKEGFPDTFLTGMDDLGNLYGVRIRVGKAIAGPLDLTEILRDDRVLQITLSPAPVAELLEGYRPEGVTHEPPVTALQEPYRMAIQRSISRSQVQRVLNAAVAAMLDDWTADAAKIKLVDRALFPLIPDETLRSVTLENLKNAEPAVEANRRAEAVRAGLADPEDATATETPEAPNIPVTPLQQAMLLKIARSEFTTINGGIPGNASETETWADAIIESAEDKGVFTSLKNAELVWHSGEKKDAGVGLTEKGFAIYQAIEAARSPAVASPRVAEAPKAETRKHLVIGLGGVPGAGKDTVADILVAVMGHAVKLSFGDVLYQEIAKAFDVPVEWLKDRTVKDTPQQALSLSYCRDAGMVEILKSLEYAQSNSPRALLQALGDARRQQDPAYLITRVQSDAQAALHAGQSVVVADLRKPEEIDMIEAFRGVTVRVRNPELEQALARARGEGSETANHPLENALQDVSMNLEIFNDGTLEELQEKTQNLLRQVQAFDTTPSARPFGMNDPVARGMLERIEASPYSLSYLLGDDRARDVSDPPFAEDANWRAARSQFADELDAVLNARIQQIVDALGERGWMQPVLHGDLTYGGAVIHLDTLQDAEGNLQGLQYRVSLAADTEGTETRTQRDYLRVSGAQFAAGLHNVAQTMQSHWEQTASHTSVQSASEALDGYVVRHILENSPMVVDQARSNDFSHFLLGNVLSGTSDAILSAIEDETLPHAVRDAARDVLQGQEGMTDYRAKIGRVIYEGQRDQPETQPTSTPDAPVISLENVGDSVSGVLTGFANDGKQLLLRQDDGSTNAVEQHAIDDWQLVGIFHGKTWMEFQKGDEERAIERLMREKMPIQLRIDINEGMGLGPVPVLRFAENGQFKDQAFVHRMEEVQANRRAADTAYSWLSEYYEKDGYAVVEKGKREASLFENDAKVSVRYVSQQNSGLATDVSLQFTKEKDQIQTALKDSNGAYIWGESQNLEKRGDMQLLIGTVEALRAESDKQQKLLENQKPLVQSCLDRYAQATRMIQGAIDAVDVRQVTYSESAVALYQSTVGAAEKEGRTLVRNAEQALQDSLQGNRPIFNYLDKQIQEHESAEQYRRIVEKCREVLNGMIDVAKNNTIQRGKDVLASANESTPIEDIAVAIFNKHGIEITNSVPPIVEYVQNRDIEGIQAAIGRNSLNNASQEVFEYMTGVKLGDTQKKRIRQIDEWAGITPEMRASIDAERKKAFENDRNIKDLEYIWDGFKTFRMQRGGDGQQYVLDRVAEGYTTVTSYPKGSSLQYGLTKPEDSDDVVYITKKRDFNNFCKAILKVEESGNVLEALRKAGLVDVATKPEVTPEENTPDDPEIDRLFTGAATPTVTETASMDSGAEDELPDLEESEEDDAHAIADENREPLPDWSLSNPDMLSPLWDLRIPFTWTNEHGVFPAGYTAEWSFGKSHFDKITIEIARDPQGSYHFSTHGAVGGYAPSVHGPEFPTFLEAHTAARQEAVDGIRKRYAETYAERGFVQNAEKMLKAVTHNADGDRYSVAKPDELLREPPYQEAFGEILSRLEGSQRLILTWEHQRDAQWMVTLHRSEEEQGIVAELRRYGEWDFAQAPEFAKVIDPGNLDEWNGFRRNIADRFPEDARNRLFLAPYGLDGEPVWQVSEPIPEHQLAQLPPAPIWPNDIATGELPVEIPAGLQNLDRYVGLRFADNRGNQIALLIGRDESGYIPNISFQVNRFSSGGAPNAKEKHYETFAEAYAQGRRMLGKRVKDFVTDDISKALVVQAANDWLKNPSGHLQPLSFGYDAARAETLWDRQESLQGITALQVTHQVSTSRFDDYQADQYAVHGVLDTGETRYLSTVTSLDRALLLINSTFTARQNTPALDAEEEREKSPLRQAAEQLLQDIEEKEKAQAAPSLGQIMAGKLDSLAAAKKLDTLFGSDEALGVRFVDHHYNEIPMTEDADGQSVFPDGSSATICTDYAEQVRQKLEGHEVQIVGFANEDNPNSAVVREEWHPGGHDFAIVDHRWLIDPWARLVGGFRDQIVYDLQDAEDAQKVAEIYGNPLNWSRSGTYSIDHETSLTLWDRSGLDAVIEAAEAIDLKASGITITEASIIPTRSGVVAVPTDPNLPVYHAGEAVPEPEQRAADWLAKIPVPFHDAMRSVIEPFLSAGAQWRYEDTPDFPPERNGSHFFNAYLTGPESWEHAEISLHAQIVSDTRKAEGKNWSLSFPKERISDSRLYALLLEFEKAGLLDTLGAVERVQQDYGGIVVTGILGRQGIGEVLACHGRQPLRVLAAVDGELGNEQRVTDAANRFLQRLQNDHPHTPISLTLMGDETLSPDWKEAFSSVASWTTMLSAKDVGEPQSLVRKADLLLQVGEPCAWSLPYAGRTFRAESKRDLNKQLFALGATEFVCAKNPSNADYASAWKVQDERNARLGDSPFADRVRPVAVGEPAMPEPAMPEPAVPESASITPSANGDLFAQGSTTPTASTQIPLPAPEDQALASTLTQERLQEILAKGVELPMVGGDSANAVRALLQSGDLDGWPVSVWSVNRADIVAQDAGLKPIRFYNGDPEQRHVFLLVGPYLVDPWMANFHQSAAAVLAVDGKESVADRYLPATQWISEHNVPLPSLWQGESPQAASPSAPEATPEEVAASTPPVPEATQPAAKVTEVTEVPETATEKAEKPAVEAPPVENPASTAPLPVEGKKMTIDWKQLAEDDRLAPELRKFLESLAAHPDLLPGVGWAWAENLSQEDLADLLADLSAKWDKEYWKAAVSFLHSVLDHGDHRPEMDLEDRTRALANDASAGLSMLLFHLESTYQMWGASPFQVQVENFVRQIDTLPDDVVLSSLAPRPEKAVSAIPVTVVTEAEATGQEATSQTAKTELSPSDKVVAIALIPLDANGRNWKAGSEANPQGWKLLAVLDDGWQMPFVFPEGVTYERAMAAAQKKAAKWGIEAYDFFQNPASSDQDFVTGYDATLGRVVFGQEAAQLAKAATPVTTESQPTNPVEQPPEVEPEKPVAQTPPPPTIWTQEFTMTQEIEQAVDYINRFFPQAQYVSDDKKAAWVHHAAETRDRVGQLLQPFFKNDPALVERWENSSYLKESIDRNLQITLGNIAVVHNDLRRGMEYLMMARPIHEPTLEEVRRYALQERIKTLTMQEMQMNTFDFVMQDGYRNPDWKGPGQNFTAPLVLYDAPNMAARIVLLRAPRVVPAGDANDLTIQSHAAKSMVNQVLREGLPQHRMNVLMNVAYFDPAVQTVRIRDLSEVAGLADAMRKEADSIAEMLQKGLVPERSRPVGGKVELTPEISQNIAELAKLQVVQDEVQERIKEQQKVLSQRLGSNPDAWPSIPGGLSLGKVTKEWSHHVEPAALDRLSELGIPRHAVETPEYDLHAMAQALRQAGIAPEQFIMESRVDPEKVKATLDAYGVPTQEYLHARPVIQPKSENATVRDLQSASREFLQNLQPSTQQPTGPASQPAKIEPVYSDMGPK